MTKRLIAIMVMAASGCAAESTPSSSPQEGSVRSELCSLDEDGNWTGDCGSGPTGGGGGGFPINTCPSSSCDPRLGWISTLNCQATCTSFSASCQPTFGCPSYNQDDPNCAIGYCADWH
jgi:hypothetical protein